MVEGADTTFELMRLEQLPVPYGDPPMGGLFCVRCLPEVADRYAKSIEDISGRDLLSHGSLHGSSPCLARRCSHS